MGAALLQGLVLTCWGCGMLTALVIWYGIDAAVVQKGRQTASLAVLLGISVHGL